MKKKIFDILIMVYILILLIYLNLGNLLRLYSMYTTEQLSFGLTFFGVFGLLIYLVYKIFNKFKLDIYDLIMFLLGVFGVISMIYAIKRDVALYGFYQRNEGLLQILTYYVVFLNCKSIDSKICKKIVVWSIIVLGCFQAIYGILQFMGIKELFDYSIIIKRNRIYSTGFEVNPNFLGTIMVVSLSLSLGMYFMKKQIFMSFLTLVISSMLFLGMLCSGAMSAVISFVGIVLLLFILFFIFKLRFRVIAMKTILLVICFVCVFFQYNRRDKGYYLSQIQKSSHEIGETLKGDSKSIYGSGRIHIWKETLKIVPDNLVNGVGIDNFYYAFGENKTLIDVKSKLSVDKVHNEYLHKLVTEGIFSFLTYFMLLSLILIKSILKIIKLKSRNDEFVIVLFLGYMAYCIQAFFNISVISVAPIFYVVMGLLCSCVKGSKNETIKCRRNSEDSI